MGVLVQDSILSENTELTNVDINDKDTLLPASFKNPAQGVSTHPCTEGRGFLECSVPLIGASANLIVSRIRLGLTMYVDLRGEII